VVGGNKLWSLTRHRYLSSDDFTIAVVESYEIHPSVYQMKGPDFLIKTLILLLEATTKL
jgi:hypothetical protein